MSLLEQLKKYKLKLRPAETILTQQDGQKFIETKDSIIKLDQRSNGYVIDLQPDDVPVEIIEHLFLGSQDCCDVHVLQTYNLTHVLSIGIDTPIKFNHIKYKFVEMLDIPETHLNIYLKPCINFIEEVFTNSNHNVLVHCNAGVSRSATIVIAYLILKRKFSFQEAFDRVKTLRACIRPNDGFVNQLKSLT